MKDTCVFMFGRFNPVHKGHYKMFSTALDMIDSNTDMRIYVSTSYDRIKNVLPYDIKIHYIQKIYPELSDYLYCSKDLFAILMELNNTYKKIIVLAGSDRSNDFKKSIDKYNGVLYNYESINVITIGNDRSDCMYSSTAMRELVRSRNFSEFKSFIDSDDDIIKEFYDVLSDYMGVI